MDLQPIAGIESWDVNSVVAWVSTLGFSQYEKKFRDAEVNGEILLCADEEMLKELKIKSVGHRMTILKHLNKLKNFYSISNFSNDDFSSGQPVPPLPHSSTQNHLLHNNRHNNHDNIDTSHTSLLASSQNSGYNISSSLSPGEILRLEDMIRERDVIIDELFKQLSELRSEIELVKQSISQSPASNLSGSIPEKSSTLSNNRLRSQTVPNALSTTSNNKSSFSISKQQQQQQLQQPTSQQDYVYEQQDTSSPVSAMQLTKQQQQLHGYQQESGAIRVYGHKLLNHDYESYKSILVSINDTCSKVLPLAMKKWKLYDDWKKYALFMAFRGQEICLSYDDRPLHLLLQYKTSTETPVFVLKSLRTTESMYAKNEYRASANDLSHLPQVQSNIQDHSHQQPQSHLSSFRQSQLFEKKNSTNSNHDNSSIFTENHQQQQLDQDEEELAVAIYEYKAERDDELDVNIGDTFSIRDRSNPGWWIVEKEGKSGWVPAGCLLEDSTATDSRPNTTSISQGIALYDYDAIGVNELSIKKGDVLAVQKKFQHWLLAELRGQQGWVPSCYVSLDESSSASNLKFSSLSISQSNFNSINSHVREGAIDEDDENEEHDDDDDDEEYRYDDTVTMREEEEMNNSSNGGIYSSAMAALPRSNTLNFNNFKSAVQSREVLPSASKESKESKDSKDSLLADTTSNTLSNNNNHDNNTSYQEVAQMMHRLKEITRDAIDVPPAKPSTSKLLSSSKPQTSSSNGPSPPTTTIGTSSPPINNHYAANALNTVTTIAAIRANMVTSTTSPGSPAISKLDSLLDSFNPYLNNNEDVSSTEGLNESFNSTSSLTNISSIMNVSFQSSSPSATTATTATTYNTLEKKKNLK